VGEEEGGAEGRAADMGTSGTRRRGAAGAVESEA
jgi:hypothetical protein